MRREELRRLVAKGTVRPGRVVIQGPKLLPVEAFVPEAAAEAFHETSFFSGLVPGISIIPNLRFQRWNVCSEMFFPRHSSTMFLPLSASRIIWTFSSIVWRLPFMR